MWSYIHIYTHNNVGNRQEELCYTPHVTLLMPFPPKSPHLSLLTLNPCAGTLHAPVVNCNSLALPSSSMLSTTSQNHLYVYVRKSMRRQYMPLHPSSSSLLVSSNLLDDRMLLSQSDVLTHIFGMTLPISYIHYCVWEGPQHNQTFHHRLVSHHPSIRNLTR